MKFSIRIGAREITENNVLLAKIGSKTYNEVNGEKILFRVSEILDNKIKIQNGEVTKIISVDELNQFVKLEFKGPELKLHAKEKE